jgi:hypothetical protein
MHHGARYPWMDTCGYSQILPRIWTLVGDVLTAGLAGELERVVGIFRDEFEIGTGDFDLYVDTLGGYFYVTGWGAFTGIEPLGKETEDLSASA